MTEAIHHIKEDSTEESPVFASGDESAAIRVPIDKICPGKMQYRGYFDEDFIAGLANNFREKGFEGHIGVIEAKLSPSAISPNPLI